MLRFFLSSCFFFFNDTATTEIYTLSLHDALPISGAHRARLGAARRPRQGDSGGRAGDPSRGRGAPPAAGARLGKARRRRRAAARRGSDSLAPKTPYTRAMRQIWLAACLLLAVPAGAEPPGSDATDWIGVGGASAELVPEPVFGGRIMLYRAGRPGAEPVVLVHGLGKAGARDWAKVIPPLAERYEVYALDLPGFGLSDKGNHLYSPANLARALDALLAERVSRPVALIGHSMGGAVALAYAAAYPRGVRRLIVVDAAGVLHPSVYSEFLARALAERGLGADAPWLEVVTRAIQAQAENLPTGSRIALHLPAVRQRLLRGDPAAIAALALVEHDFSNALRAIRAPTLVVWGSDDRIAPLRTGQALAAVIPGARLVGSPAPGPSPRPDSRERFAGLVLDELGGRLGA